MTFQFHTLRAAALLALGTVLLPAHATNGYFPHGFGLKAKGMGGTAVALTHDAFAGVNNPASAAYVGNRYDVGAEIFLPKRSARVSTPLGAMDVESGKSAFLIPEFGYNVALSNQLALGLTVYGNGGMNTQYPSIFPGDMNFMCSSPVACGTGKLGVNLMQLIVAPTVAYKWTENHSLGLSPLLVYQQFEAYGLQAFGLPNQGKDSSAGLGVRLGYMGKFGNAVTVGASYSPKINMSRFKDYANLFAEGGGFDIPENYVLGVALQVSPAVQVALDYSRINYSQVPAVGNASLANFANGFGAPNGPGFGWRDVKAVKLGVQWQMNSLWTLRAGYNHGTNPVQSADVYLNTLAPGVIKSHVTLGGTYAISPQEELTFAAWHGKKNTVSGTAPAPTSVSMSQNGFGLQYSRRF
ncbi:MAG: outer membrane protein transport protein [Hydrogenophaga sp.]|uniref:OmpP1/FadL family transporter n=1 Tax=Hydrogenophaga sp. TaxID=1904254 RepID=UPI002ABAA3FF|nr:outer membrane protein transport protein [Hydrogenophaga sp.]MDZ4189136.1 outer membrane protein transport protein [Hydrogenophaga sp.]